MTASCLSTPRLVRSAVLPAGVPAAALSAFPRLGGRRRRGCAGVGLAVLALLLLAALLAPEQPIAQGSICERHNGAAACRVW